MKKKNEKKMKKMKKVKNVQKSKYVQQIIISNVVFDSIYYLL